MALLSHGCTVPVVALPRESRSRVVAAPVCSPAVIRPTLGCWRRIERGPYHDSGESRMKSTPTVDWDAVIADPRFQTLHRKKQAFLTGLMIFSVACQ